MADSISTCTKTNHPLNPDINLKALKRPLNLNCYLKVDPYFPIKIFNFNVTNVFNFLC